MEYKCTICGLHYRSRELADRCYAWCSAHHSCNLEIGRQSMEAERHVWVR
ncbi:MAG: hypothetical protein KGH69_02995 [Candidatus Micrarchaeota archaeon]|nr:hypothetical protein [Candidatus Micrarchaeota archaeon]